jgi:hypothetical protein
MSFTRVAVLTLTVSMLTASGCGGGSSKPMTRAELTTKANAICKRVHIQLISLSSSNQNPVQIFSQAASYEQTAHAELQKLSPPSALASDWKQIVATMGTLAEDSAKYLEYTAAKNLAGARALAETYGPVKLKAVETAQHAQIKECSRAF